MTNRSDGVKPTTTKKDNEPTLIAVSLVARCRIVVIQTHQKLMKKTTKFYSGNDRYCMREKKKFRSFFLFFKMINKG